MTEQYFKYPTPFIVSTKKDTTPIVIVRSDDFKPWLDKQSAFIKQRLEFLGIEGTAGQASTLTNSKGQITKILFIIGNQLSLYDGAKVSKKLSGTVDEKILKSMVFDIEGKDLSEDDLHLFCKGWALEAYSFDLYKSKPSKQKPVLLLPKSVKKKDIMNAVEPVYLMRSIVNTPANDFGPDEMENVCEKIAEDYKAEISVIAGEDLLKENYPLIHTVGDASPRRPRLIELKWGKDSDPKVTLVGKGVCYDTGGLSLKTTRSMLLMRKDMSGAAHVLALALMIINHKLPINLRVLIPTVDNDVSGGAMRPGDISSSRKGLTVEITNTDAEGRLILSDALTAASEDNPELIIDYATLTGAKMSALGHDISAYFSNNKSIVQELQNYSEEQEDPLWPFPIYKDYQKFVESKHADLKNSALSPGDLLYSAMYLYQFIDQSIDWVHFDIYAWEGTGRPGRSAGSKECGLRTMYAYLENRYGNTDRS